MTLLALRQLMFRAELMSTPGSAAPGVTVADGGRPASSVDADADAGRAAPAATAAARMSGISLLIRLGVGVVVDRPNDLVGEEDPQDPYQRVTS